MVRRRVLQTVATISLLIFIGTTFSVTRYVLAHPNDPLQQNVASWARNKGLGAIVDQLETWTHSEAPAVAPADTLALVTLDSLPPETSTSVVVPSSSVVSPVVSTTTKPIGTAPPATKVNAVATQSCPTQTTTTLVGQTTTTSSTTTTSTTTTSSTLPGETTTTTTTTTTIPTRPLDIAPTVEPALRGEGEWAAAMRVRTKPVVYATSIRPLWCFGSVVATMAAYNPTLVHAALFNGNEVPGGKGWRNGSKVRGRALPSLIASFNGGFRFEHNPGGYFTEGKTIQKLVKGYATFGIRADGTSHVGVWGEDMHEDDTWTSLRQNLPPLIADGKSVYKQYDKVDWGKDFDNKVYNFRSAVCTRTDGMIMFVAVGKVNISMLADSLIVLGCDTAMELDINGTWPHFAGYYDFGKKSRRGFTIDTRMGDPDRHLNGSTKDFFALFDPETLPKGAVK
ncbi:unannotated protein [freshwater metagenome]|uniref:Unannotated protein n=1 Tax=freshwater metagenome TaxID=449393 RepID=A0A6J6HRR8_9ZZZZ|nr:hypothetical protein [Actinomycetota bacterium]